MLRSPDKLSTNAFPYLSGFMGKDNLSITPKYWVIPYIGHTRKFYGFQMELSDRARHCYH